MSSIPHFYATGTAYYPSALGQAIVDDTMQRQYALAVANAHVGVGRLHQANALAPAQMNLNCDDCGAPLKYDGFHDCRYCGRTK